MRTLKKLVMILGFMLSQFGFSSSAKDKEFDWEEGTRRFRQALKERNTSALKSLKEKIVRRWDQIIEDTVKASSSSSDSPKAKVANEKKKKTIPVLTEHESRYYDQCPHCGKKFEKSNSRNNAALDTHIWYKCKENTKVDPILAGARKIVARNGWGSNNLKLDPYY